MFFFLESALFIIFFPVFLLLLLLLPAPVQMGLGIQLSHIVGAS